MVVDDGRPILQYVCVCRWGFVSLFVPLFANEKSKLTFGGQVENLPVRKVDVATIGLVVLRVGRRLKRAEQAKVR